MPAASLTQLLRAPLNQMPAYSEKALSDRDIADIHAYLASIPAPPAVKDIPLLNY
jgi:ubiquinol-cytochrome c reductase cytochrome c subunit